MKNNNNNNGKEKAEGAYYDAHFVLERYEDMRRRKMKNLKSVLEVQIWWRIKKAVAPIILHVPGTMTD